MSLDVSLTLDGGAGHSATAYEANITHNLTKMASEAGLYEACWKPEELGVTTAKQLAPFLSVGLVRLVNDPERFRSFNPANGWGDYDGFVEFVRKYRDACLMYPKAEVSVWRMTDPNHDELRRLAEAATKNPDYTIGVYEGLDFDDKDMVFVRGSLHQGEDARAAAEADRAFASEASPSAILAMLDEVEALEHAECQCPRCGEMVQVYP